MQRIKRMVKNISAISAGALMFGATMAGALAASDLTTYPAPFVDASKKSYNYMMVVGNTGVADAADAIGAVDIGRGLDKTEVSSSGTSVSVVGGKSEDIPLGQGITNSTTVGFDRNVEDDDVSSLFDGEINFKSSNYDVREVLLLSGIDPRIQTSLTSADDDYESQIVLEVRNRDAIKYVYAFDETINIANATTSDSLEIKFLGRTLKVTDADDSATTFTAQVGTEYFMKVGESVSIDVDGVAKTATLQNVGSGGSVVVDVDGTVQTLSADTTRTINGVEVTNDDTFYDSNDVSQRSATLVMGKQATETFKDGDPYPGTGGTCSNEDPNDLDCWLWDIAGMTSSGTTTIPSDGGTAITGTYIAIENDFVINDDKDNPPVTGECVNLPYNYLSICFDSLTVADDDYATYTFEYESSADFSQVGGSWAVKTSTGAIHITTSVDDGLELIGTALDHNNVSTNKKFKEAWITVNDTNTSLAVLYKDKDDNRVKLGGTVNENSTNELLRIRYKDTKDTNVVLMFGTSLPTTNGTHILGNAAGLLNLSIDTLGDSTNELNDAESDLVMQWKLTTYDFSGLGATASTEEAAELTWLTNKAGGANQTIGSKDEDHRELYGIIVRDPKSHSSSDEVVLEIPADQVQANVVIKGSAATVSGSGGSILSQFAKAPAVVTADELASATGKNLILVGGPCVNKLTADFLGLTYPACGADSGMSPGEAIIKLVDNGDKVAMIVAGWSADDTRRASAALENYKAYAGKLKGSEVVVTGTGTTVTDVRSR